MTRSMTPKPGDIYIVLNNGQGSITYLLPRDKVSDLDRKRMERLTDTFRRLFIEGHDIVGAGYDPETDDPRRTQAPRVTG